MKRTFQPKKLKRIRKFGYRERSKTTAGKKVLLRRRRKGRKSLSATENYKLYRKKPNNAVR